MRRQPRLVGVPKRCQGARRIWAAATAACGLGGSAKAQLSGMPCAMTAPACDAATDLGFFARPPHPRTASASSAHTPACLHGPPYCRIGAGAAAAAGGVGASAKLQLSGTTRWIWAAAAAAALAGGWGTNATAQLLGMPCKVVAPASTASPDCCIFTRDPSCCATSAFASAPACLPAPSPVDVSEPPAPRLLCPPCSRPAAHNAPWGRPPAVVAPTPAHRSDRLPVGPRPQSALPGV